MMGLVPNNSAPKVEESSTTVLNAIATCDTAEPCESDWLHSGFRYALALTNHHQDAEDLVQQGCLRLYNKYGGIRRLPLLFTTIRHLFFDQRQRSAKLRMVSLHELDEGEIGTDSSVDSIPSLDRLEIQRLMASLRANEREVLFFHYVHGYTAAEIAELTRQPRGTVLSLLQRSRKKLGNLLEPGPDVGNGRHE